MRPTHATCPQHGSFTAHTDPDTCPECGQPLTIDPSNVESVTTADVAPADLGPELPPVDGNPIEAEVRNDLEQLPVDPAVSSETFPETVPNLIQHLDDQGQPANPIEQQVAADLEHAEPAPPVTS